jgi:hypothetical protein
MHPEFNAQSFEPFALRKKLNGQHMLTNPSPASDGFNVWWQKTAAQNMATVTEAYDLMREHHLVSSDDQKSTAFALKTKET